MVIGVPRELKNEERRIAMVPGGAQTLVARGHRVLVESRAGVGSGFNDEAYARVGAEILPAAGPIFETADLLLKVKEPLPAEYEMLREGQILFTYLHLAASEALTLNLLRRKIVGIAYETVETEDGFLPLLSPMSEIAGRMAPQEGAKYLEETFGGRGVLLGGVPGVPPAQVVIFGAGNVGSNAARIAVGMGATVTILDIDPRRLRSADDFFGGRVITMIADDYNVRTVLAYADLVISAVLVHGAKAPRLITREMLRSMKTGSVLVDVAIDQGGIRRDLAPYHSRRSDLPGRGGDPLYGGKHAGRPAPHGHQGAHGQHPSLRAESRGQWLEGGGAPRQSPFEGRKPRPGKGNLQGSGRSLRPRLYPCRRDAHIEKRHPRSSFRDPWRPLRAGHRSAKHLSLFDLVGCFSFLRAFASICLILSRVTSNTCPTSSRVWS